ncbi:MAG: S8 family serine peptidase [Candidatus Eiseniibacteriota bacterium]
MNHPSALYRTLCVVLWTLLYAPSAGAWVGPGAGVGASGASTPLLPDRQRPSSVVVRLKAGVPVPSRALAFGAVARVPPEARPSGASLELTAQIGNLPGLAARAQATGALGVEDIFGDLLGDLLGAPGELPPIYRLVYPEGTDLKAAALTLMRAPEVEWAEPSVRFRVTWDDADRFLAPVSDLSLPSRPFPPSRVTGDSLFLPDDPLFEDGSQWGLWNLGTGPFGGVAGGDIAAPAGWSITTGSTATRVAIVDTGTDLGHPDLARTLADGTARIVRAFNASEDGPGASAWDSVGHGTMVAGVAVALTNNGPLLDGRGVAGVCGGAGGDSAGCRVIAIKATPTRLIDALGEELARGIVFANLVGARVVNLSFGGDEDSRVVLAAMEDVAVRGTVVVCGAGNGQDARPQYPGYYASYGVGVSVAAIKSDGTLARFSTRGPQIDVAAPGENIYSTYLTYENAYQNPRRNFEYTSGTSFAAPHVAGLAGLAMTLQPSLTDNEFQQFLRWTAEDAGAPGRDDTFGWGVPHARRLLERLAPPRSFERGSVQAETWTLIGTDSITLAKTGLDAFGCSIDGRHLAERWEGRAHVTLPPGRFLETPEVLVRTHGTRGYGAGNLHEYDIDQGEVVPGTVTHDGFDVRTYIYRIAAPPLLCSVHSEPIGYVPGPPHPGLPGEREQAGQIAWTAFGLRDEPPVVTITFPSADGQVWSVDTPETLRWEASDPDQVTGFAIARSIDGGASWQSLTSEELPGTARAFAWKAPCGEVDAPYLIRVTAFDRNDQVDEGSAARQISPSRRCFPGESPEHIPSFTVFPVIPNPASGQVLLRYAAGVPTATPAGGTCRLSLHDVRGRRVRSYDVPPAASGLVVWDGRDSAGRAVRPGLYLLRIEGGGSVAGSRFVYLGVEAE